jgi:hypothetical protein
MGGGGDVEHHDLTFATMSPSIMMGNFGTIKGTPAPYVPPSAFLLLPRLSINSVVIVDFLLRGLVLREEDGGGRERTFAQCPGNGTFDGTC